MPDAAPPAPAPSPAPAPAPSPATDSARPAAEIPEETREPRDPARRAPPPPRAPEPEKEPAAAQPPATQPPAPAPAPEPPPAPTPRAPVSAAVRAALDSAAAKIEAGNGGEAVAELRAAEERLGESADLRLMQARAFVALADAAIARGDDSFLVKGLVADGHLRWKQATAIDPTVPGARVVRARILRFEENPAAAKQLLEEAVAADASDADAHRVLAEMAVASRDWAAADTHWTKVATLVPADGRARLQATIAKQWMRVPQPLLEDGYVEAARLLPDDPEPARLLAQLAPRDREKKLALLRRAADGNAKAVWPRIWIAHVLRTEAPIDLDGARRMLGEAAAVAPRNPAVHYNLGLVLEAKGAPLDALPAYVACVENSPAGDCGQASDAIDRLLNDPQSPVSRTAPLTLRVRAYDAVCEKNPEVGRYGNNAGLWFRDVGKDYEKSLRYYLAACRAEPNDQDFLNDTGLIYLFHLRDRVEECRTYFDRVIALVEEDGQDPIRGYWDTLENLCRYWFEHGEYAKVVACAKKRADPKANIDGTPYPSRVAAQWGAAAQKKLDEKK